MTRVANKTAVAAADAMAGGPGRAHFSSDTYVNPHTLLCARLAAGACADVATAVVRWLYTFAMVRLSMKKYLTVLPLEARAS